MSRTYHQDPDYSKYVYLLEIDGEQFAETASSSASLSWERSASFLKEFEDEVLLLARIVRIPLAEKS